MKKFVGVACVLAALGAGCASGDDGDDTQGGSGGAVNGSGGAGTAGAPALTGECAMADTSAGPAALHAAAAALLAADKPCAFSGCHGGTVPAGTLKLFEATDLRMALVGKMSCEAPSVPLVDGSGNAAALSNSWLWTKLTGPTDDTTGLAEQPTWGGPGTCGQMTGQKYGVRMPWGINSMLNSEARLAPIRNWICAGAPGP